MSLWPIEKKATSEPDISAEITRKTIIMMEYIKISGLNPAVELNKKIKPLKLSG
jgi:hypothetical protein